MIASLRGLCAAAAIAVVLAVIAAIDLSRTPAAVDHALVPGFDPARATALIWERAGQPAIRAERAGERWELRAPAAMPADAAAIGEVLAALRGARWHRRGDPPAPQATLTVALGDARHVIGIAAALAGTEQRWLIVDGRGLLVDSWVARALDRDRLALQIRRPFAEVGSARTIAVTGPPGAAGTAVDLQLDGTPRRLTRPHPLRLAPPIDGALDGALRGITIVRRPDSAPGRGGLAIRTAGPGQGEVSVVLGGDCPGAPALVAMTGSTGDGCIERSAAAAVEAAVARLAQPPATIAARSPVPFAPQQIVLADGATLETSPPRIGGAAADGSRVKKLCEALAAPAEVTPLPAGPSTGHIVATERGGDSVTLDLFADRILARRGEPIALRVDPGAWQLLVRPSRELRDLGLWLEEPTTITALTIDDVRYERGAVIGAWQRRPAAPSTGSADAARVDALVTQLAAPRAIGFTDERFATAHRVAIEVTPPIGAPSRHTLELGAPRPTGCPARAGRDTVVLPAALCTALAALR